MPNRQQQYRARLAEILADPERIQIPPTHPRGPRAHRRAHRLAMLLRAPQSRPRFRAPRPARSPFPPMDRGRPTTPEQVAARAQRRAEAQARKANHYPRWLRLRDLREVQPGATRSDVRALLHRIARDRRDGV